MFLKDREQYCRWCLPVCGMSEAAEDTSVHECLTHGAGITARGILRCEIARCVLAPLWPVQPMGCQKWRPSSSLLIGWQERQSDFLSLTASPALGESVVKPPTGREYATLVHISSISSKAGHSFACLLANSISCGNFLLTSFAHFSHGLLALSLVFNGL